MFCPAVAPPPGKCVEPAPPVDLKPHFARPMERDARQTLREKRAREEGRYRFF